MEEKFGKSAKKLFHIDPELIVLNHASFGYQPHVVTEKRFELIREQNANPDTWYCETSIKMYKETVQRLALFLHAEPEDIALVDNVTTGLNTILKSMDLKGCKVLLTKHCFEGVHRIVDELSDHNSVQQVIFPVDLPIESVDEFLIKFEDFVTKHADISMAILEHISCPSGINFPVKEMVTILKKHDILSAIDGAHATGQINLNLTDLNADFYTASLYKWCFTPIPCGFIWVAKQYKEGIRPLVSSIYYNSHDNLQRPFESQGTRDLSTFYTIPTALDFMEEIGGVEVIAGYAKKLLHEAKVDICKSLPLKELQVPDEMKAPCLLLLELPEGIIDVKRRRSNNNNWASLGIFENQNIRTFFCAFDNKNFIRITATIYNCKEDYNILKVALKKLLDEPTTLKLIEW